MVRGPRTDHHFPVDDVEPEVISRREVRWQLESEQRRGPVDLLPPLIDHGAHRLGGGLGSRRLMPLDATVTDDITKATCDLRVHGRELYKPVRGSTLQPMSTMSVSEARAALPEILDRVIAGEEVTITRHGREVAVIVRPDAIRVRRADQALAEAERLRNLLDRGRSAHLSDAPVLSVERAEELVAEVAASRSGR